MASNTPSTPRPGRRQALLCGIALLLPAAARAQARAAAGPLVEIWKSPTCGCCKDWVAHLEANGFRTLVRDNGNAQIRSRLGVAPQYGGCHTALVGGYAIEGHVPAADIRRLLKERPKAVGLAVPGMPVGAPGMDGPAYGGHKDPYDVLLLVAAHGDARVYQTYR